MCLGSILLEGHNEEFWVALGCLSDDIALKQHAFIRGLQLDVSLAVAWAYIGKVYRREGELQLAQQAFDRVRSIDPSLALPWAGMSADAEARNLNENEAYECCLRAVQIFPLAVRLNQALINFGLDFLEKRGFTALQTPFFMRKDIMAKCAQLAQFDEELYKWLETDLT